MAKLYNLPSFHPIGPCFLSLMLWDSPSFPLQLCSIPVTPRSGRDAEDRSETSSQTATAHTASHVYVPTALETRQPSKPPQGSQSKFQGVKISSDLDTDTEVDAGIFGSSRKPSDNFDFDFYD
ncbi:hypothetical protein PoB_002101500 [Plakobranchus ocellatus]|uniref:Uncharacterized protein n=1 Tax=Plakobranchus ocellatus TaxID=259542 RepID=A0AAV3ZIX3_9GAST|nr:hypothetical protein PoB_002101500 [Plakobranchus ocellatus]